MKYLLEVQIKQCSDKRILINNFFLTINKRSSFQLFRINMLELKERTMKGLLITLLLFNKLLNNKYPPLLSKIYRIKTLIRIYNPLFLKANLKDIDSRDGFTPKKNKYYSYLNIYYYKIII